MDIMWEKLSDAQILQDWDGLRKRHRSEIAAAVARYCVGRAIKEVARLLDRDSKWVKEHLDLHAVQQGGVRADLTEGGDASPRELPRDDVRHILAEFAPSDEDVAEDVKTYEIEGYQPAVAKRLARAEWAGRAAKQAKAAPTLRKSPPDPEGVSMSEQLRVLDACCKVFDAARIVDKTKISVLEKQEIVDRIVDADRSWNEQIARIGNLNPESAHLFERTTEAPGWG